VAVFCGASLPESPCACSSVDPRHMRLAILSSQGIDSLDKNGLAKALLKALGPAPEQVSLVYLATLKQLYNSMTDIREMVQSNIRLCVWTSVPTHMRLWPVHVAHTHPYGIQPVDLLQGILYQRQM
jgi:hypothetical protein